MPFAKEGFVFTYHTPIQERPLVRQQRRDGSFLLRGCQRIYRFQIPDSTTKAKTMLPTTVARNPVPWRPLVLTKRNNKKREICLFLGPVSPRHPSHAQNEAGDPFPPRSACALDPDFIRTRKNTQFKSCSTGQEG